MRRVAFLLGLLMLGSLAIAPPANANDTNVQSSAVTAQAPTVDPLVANAGQVLANVNLEVPQVTADRCLRGYGRNGAVTIDNGLRRAAIVNSVRTAPNRDDEGRWCGYANAANSQQTPVNAVAKGRNADEEGWCPRVWPMHRSGCVYIAPFTSTS